VNDVATLAANMRWPLLAFAAAVSADDGFALSLLTTPGAVCAFPCDDVPAAEGAPRLTPSLLPRY